MEKKTTSNDDHINKIVIFNRSEIVIQLCLVMVKILSRNKKHKKREIVGAVAKDSQDV